MGELIHWFLTAPLVVIFAAGIVLGVPLWALIAWLVQPAPLPPYVSPYAHAQQEYERARDAYQRSIREARDGRPD